VIIGHTVIYSGHRSSTNLRDPNPSAKLEQAGYEPDHHTGAKIVIPNPTASETIRSAQPMNSFALIPYIPSGVC
jgi:hypothetical protein